jgi:hypothetical protein
MSLTDLKVDGIQTARVILKDGLTILDLKPGNAVTVSKLRQIIKNNGFVSKEVTATAGGTVAADQKTFIVSGTNEALRLEPGPPQRIGDDWKLVVPPVDKP